MEKQTIDIQELKKLVEDANTTKTAPKQAKGSRTMASHLAAVVAASPFRQVQAKPVQPRGGPNIGVDLSVCDVTIKERTFSELRKHFEASLQGFEGTRNVVLKSINIDGKKEHQGFLFFTLG